MARFNVTIQSSQVAADLTDFPVYIDLSDMPASFWATVSNGGGDIRCYKADGTTELPREVVFCDTGTDTGELHVQYTGTLSGSTDTVIQIDVDGVRSDYAASATYGSQNVWDDNFVAVYHLQNADPSTGQTDSTANGNNLSATNVESTDEDTTSPLAGFGEAFDGGERQTITDNATFDWTTAMTVTAWAKYTTDQDGTIFSKGAGSASEMLVWYDQGTTDFTVGVLTNSGFVNGSSGGSYTARTNNVWYHLAATYNAGATTMRINKVNNFTDTTGTAISTGTNTIGIGDQADGTRPLAGAIDEERISNIARSTNWTDTEYNNQSNTSTFYTVTEANPTELSDGLYYWRVRAKDPAGSNSWGNWTTTRSFTVVGTPNYTITQTTDALKRRQYTDTHTTDSNKKKALTTSHTTSSSLNDTGNFTYESQVSAPTNDNLLANSYNATDYSNVATDDNAYKDQTGSGFILEQGWVYHDNNTDEITVTWRGKSTLAPTSSTVYLQVYNHIGDSWTTLDTDSTTAADTEFELTGTQTTNLSNYYDTGNRVAFRVYQGTA